MRKVRPYGWRERVGFKCVGESLTEQGHASRADVNFIVARFRQTNVLPEGREGAYGDVTGLQRSLQERIEFSRTLMDQANEFMDKHRKEQAIIAKELEELELRKKHFAEFEAGRSEGQDAPQSVSK